MQRRFLAGDRVIISDDFFWAGGATGTVKPAPAQVVALSGEWNEGMTRIEVSALGKNLVYWVEFDEPQLDASGDGPYRAGQIWESALMPLSAKPN